jgi:hydrogenase expression/formation protein HypD
MEDLRDPKLVSKAVEKIKALAGKDKFKFCHVCGTHEYTITRYGLRSLLPENIEVIAGPGCPVCITPARDIEEAIYLAEQGVVVCSFGDVIRVPGGNSSLAEAKAKGAEVRVVYGPIDALRMAAENPSKDIVFFATGFETTSPTTAATVVSNPPENFSLLVSHRLIPPAMELMVGVGEHRLDGFIAPGHVSTIIGTEPYEILPRAYQMPTVIAGFEPIDVLMGIVMLLKQIREKDYRVDNVYSRSVRKEGNPKARALLDKVYRVVSGEWRGIGRIPFSALELNENFRRYDAREKYEIEIGDIMDLDPQCSCHLVIIGRLYPKDCKLFGKACTPSRPRGPCMVSIEGTCYIAYRYGG